MTTIQKLYENGKAAQQYIEDWNQEQIDNLLKHIAAAVYKHADELADIVFQETKIGSREGSSFMMHIVPLTFASYLDGKKSFGLLSDDPERCIKTYAKAAGVIALLTPSTTNISNACENGMKAIKSGNAVIFAPHPLAWKSHKLMVEIMMEAAKAVGAPDGLIQSLENPSMDDTNELMRTCDMVVGTGGAEMVKAAYSSGTPAIGVGQGCVPVVISPSWPAGEVESVAVTNITNRCSMNGVPCTCPQMVYIPREREAEFLDAYQKNGALLVEDKEIIDRIRDVVFPDGGTRINRKIVGKMPADLADFYGIDVPEGTKVILIKMPSGVCGEMDTLCGEVMNPTLRYQVYDSYEEAVELARKGLFYEGAGHSAQIFSYEEAEIDLAAKRLPVVRIMVRQGSDAIANMNMANGLAPSSSIGCGTWGGTSLSDNMDYPYMQNKTMVVYPRGNGQKLKTPEEVFGDLIK